MESEFFAAQLLRPRMAASCPPSRCLSVLQVVRLPEGAVLLADSATATAEMWSYGDNVLAIQGHPEMPNEAALEKILPAVKGWCGRQSQEMALTHLSTLTRLRTLTHLSTLNQWHS
jgi:hypothetical protein